MENELFQYQDLKYRDFNSRLIPNISKELIIGVRMPELRKIAKKIDNCELFLNKLPHKYLEENVLHAILISIYSDDIKIVIDKVLEFLPYVDNWYTCDAIILPIYKKYSNYALKHIIKCLKSKHPYTVRYAIDMLIRYYLDEEFDNEHLIILSKIKSDNYYVKMAIAWYYSIALVKQYNVTIKLFETKILDSWIHNKAIRKAIESFRITKEQKDYLRTLKVTQ